MAAGDYDASHEHSAARTEPFICNPTTQQRRPIDARRVSAHDQAGVMRLKLQSALRYGSGHVEKQNRSQAIEAEPFPHLGKKERGKSTRMTKESAGINNRRGTGSGAISGCPH